MGPCYTNNEDDVDHEAVLDVECFYFLAARRRRFFFGGVIGCCGGLKMAAQEVPDTGLVPPMCLAHVLSMNSAKIVLVVIGHPLKNVLTKPLVSGPLPYPILLVALNQFSTLVLGACAMKSNFSVENLS